MAHTHPLEGDGTQVNLFHYLCKKGQNLDEERLHFRIPDTIVFYNFPMVWYYWSETKKEICKKGGKELERNNILLAMKKKKEESGNRDCDILASFLSHRQDSEEDSITFFNEAELDEFLANREQVQQHGLLQQFVYPRGERNEMIQAVWSPRLCLVNKRVSRFKLNDKKYTRTERAITFEGATHYSEEALCAPSVHHKVKEGCVSFADHFKSVEHSYAISRMVLYFKEDKKDGRLLWLIFSSSFRINEVKYVQKKPPLTLTPQFQGLFNEGAEYEAQRSMHLQKSRPQTAPAKRYRGGYLRNVRVEDMEALAKAALSAGIAQDDEGAKTGLLPLSQMPLPRSLMTSDTEGSGTRTPRSMLRKRRSTKSPEFAPNDTIKSEMLLERIYFNRKTKLIRKEIKKWEKENQMKLEELRELRIRNGKPVDDLGPVPSAVLPTLPERCRSAPPVAAAPPRMSQSRSPSGQLEQTRKHSAVSAASTGASDGNRPPSSPARRASHRPLSAADESSTGEASDEDDAVRSRREKLSAKQQRIKDALELLTVEPRHEKAQRHKRASHVQYHAHTQPSRQEEQVPQVIVDRILRIVGPSVQQSYRRRKYENLELCDELDDSIYSCYSELSLQRKSVGYFVFTLPQSLSDIVESTFPAYLDALRIQRFEIFTKELEERIRKRKIEEAQREEFELSLERARGKPLPAAEHRKSRAGRVTSVAETGPVPVEVGPELSNEAPKSPIPTEFGEVSTLKSGVEPLVKYAIAKQERSTVNEFNRFLQKVRDHMIAVTEEEELRALEYLRQRTSSASWHKLMEGVLARAHVGTPASSAARTQDSRRDSASSSSSSSSG
eukprot:TRINITY_DN4656_c0_g1_i2.p1 TRINITY_DN4656_c0_g1~~TRINITY_DN4656_c0_g1_i2.p1  ORF type:complete len:838 (+),score=131.35 TRINITY_DN4656_c0_g1_i2:42-2555(+)